MQELPPLQLKQERCKLTAESLRRDLIECAELVAHGKLNALPHCDVAARAAGRGGPVRRRCPARRRCVALDRLAVAVSRNSVLFIVIIVVVQRVARLSNGHRD